MHEYGHPLVLLETVINEHNHEDLTPGLAPTESVWYFLILILPFLISSSHRAANLDPNGSRKTRKTGSFVPHFRNSKLENSEMVPTSEAASLQRLLPKSTDVQLLERDLLVVALSNVPFERYVS